MKVSMLVEDRDEAYLFLDAAAAPSEAMPFDLVLVGVCFDEITNEEETLWLESATMLQVVKRETYDFETADMSQSWPIPTPVICLDEADYKLHLER